MNSLLRKINNKNIIQFRRPRYIYLQVTPILGTRNYNNKDLANSIYKLLVSLQRTEKLYNSKDKFHKLQVNFKSNISYILSIKKKSTQFLFKVPQQIETQFTSKLQETFKDSLISKVKYHSKEIQHIKFLAYRNSDPLSLHIDSRQQELINNILENIELLKDDDSIEIKMEFDPVQKLQKIRFKDCIKDVEKRIKSGESVRVSNGVMEGLSIALMNSGIAIMDALLVREKDNTKTRDMIYALANQEQFKLNKASLSKKTSDYLNVNIQISSTNRKALDSVVNSFSILDEDNSLVPRKFSTTNVMSISEVGQLVQICGNEEIMNKYNIDHLKHREIKLPSEIKQGTIRTGFVNYRNSIQNTYISDEGDNKYLALAITGSSRCGKTNYIKNIINDALAAGDSVIFLDFIETCKASREIMKVIPKEKIITINLASEQVEGLDFNELKINDDMSTFDKYTILKQKANGILKLIDSCNLSNDEDLKSRMKKYLMSATLLVFAQNKPFSYVIEMLQNHKIRKEFIDKVPKDLLSKLKGSVENMKELDEKAKNGAIVGTKQHIISGVLNRIYTLQANVALERMLETDNTNNINLIQEMQKGKAIFIQIPDRAAKTNAEKDVICAYYFNRIWFALQQRAEDIEDKKRKRTLIIIDEIYQLPNTEALVKERINQIAKFRAKFIVSCHSLNQIKNLKHELLTSDASYVIISGSDASNLKDLKGRIDDYTTDDLKKLKQYYAICCVKTITHGYVNFIAKLPPKIAED